MALGGTRQGAGRPKGSINKTSEAIRCAMLELVEDNLEQIQADLLELTPYQRLKVITGLLGKVMPTKIESINEEPAQIQFIIQPEGEAPEVD